MPKARSVSKMSNNSHRYKRRNGISLKENKPLTLSDSGQRISNIQPKPDADIHRSSFTEAFECSLDLFPHLIYISELTKDFVNRAAGVLEIPKNRSFLETDIKCIHIYVLTSDALTSPSLLRRCKLTRKAESWPYILFISVYELEQVMVDNGIVFMDRLKYKNTKKMLEIKHLDTKTIRAVITQPDVREVHEALTELLEIPILKFLIEIKQKNPNSAASHKLNMLSTELDVLLNTVKHVASSNTTQKSASACESVSEIPENLRNYLSRKREVFGFGIWNNDDFRVFVKHKNKERHLRENLLTAYADFFAVKRLNVLVCQPCFFPYFQQGDKIIPWSLPSEDSPETILYQREKVMAH